MKSLLIQKVRWEGRLVNEILFWKKYIYFVHSKYPVNPTGLSMNSFTAFLWSPALMNGKQCFVIEQSFSC